MQYAQISIANCSTNSESIAGSISLPDVTVPENVEGIRSAAFPTWEEYHMTIAHLTSLISTNKQKGACLIDGGKRVISTATDLYTPEDVKMYSVDGIRLYSKYYIHYYRFFLLFFPCLRFLFNI